MKIYQRKIREWVNSDSKREGLSFDDLEGLRVYVRKSHRLVPYEENHIVECLDVANTEIKLQSRGKGNFTLFIECFEEVAEENDKAVFIESVITDRFHNFFRKRKYKDYNEIVKGSHSWIKLPPKIKIKG